MPTCSVELLYLQASWTNFSAGMAFLRHMPPLPLLSTYVWRGPPQGGVTLGQCGHCVLCGHDSPNLWACAVLQMQVHHAAQWTWSCGKPYAGYSEPCFWTACRAITLSRLSAYKSYIAWYQAKAIQQAAKRSMCWSMWRPSDFQGNLFSGRQLMFAVSNLLKRPPHPLFHEFKPFPWGFSRLSAF